jgi:hypothetical protein
MGVKIIDDAIKRDVDLQMQDIAAKREGANETVRMAKLLMEQGATSREAADYIRNLQILSATERAKALAQRAGTWRAEDIDPTTGMPRPGTRSFAANEALINANLQARQFVGAWEAERAGKERQTTEQAVKNASQTQKSVAKREVPLEAAPSSTDALSEAGFYVMTDRDGKQRYYAAMNPKGIDIKAEGDKIAAIETGKKTLIRAKQRLNSLKDRTLTRGALDEQIGQVKGLISGINFQGALTTAEQKDFADKAGGATGLLQLSDIVNEFEDYLFTRQTDLSNAMLGKEVDRKTAYDAAERGLAREAKKPKKLGEPWPSPLLTSQRKKQFAFSTRTTTRCSCRRATRSGCFRAGKAMAWPQVTRFPCAFLASVMSRWSTQAKPCRCSSAASAKRRHLARTSANARKPNSAASVAPLARRLLASSKARQRALATPR